MILVEGMLVACVTHRISGEKVPIAVQVNGEDLRLPIVDSEGGFVRFYDLLYDRYSLPLIVPSASRPETQKNGGGTAKREITANGNEVQTCMVYGCCGGKSRKCRGKGRRCRQLLEAASEDTLASQL